jgi:hypothetical protein
MSQIEPLERLLEHARRLASAGDDEPAKQAYIDVLRLLPSHFDALNELAAVALATGHRSAARTAYTQAVRCHPQNPVGRVNLGNLHFQDGDLHAAREQYEAALEANPEFPEAHQGLARTLDELGFRAAAEEHRYRGFTGHASVVKPYRGRGAALSVLLLVSARFGNVATQLILDDRVFSVTALYVDFFDPGEPLPPHTAVFNAIGDADLCAATLERAASLVTRTRAPVINLPERVLQTGRLENARRLAGLTGVTAPAVRRIARGDHAQFEALGESLGFPLLLRSPGYHMGTHFVRVDRPSEILEAVASLPGEELFAIEYLDARGRDGLARKYRAMFLGGEIYPLHLAISADWKVHYFSAAMGELRHREEEQRFLDDMRGVLGPVAMSGLGLIQARLGLDYAGIDFGVGADGSVLLFEANATMVIVPPPPEPIWDYRRAAIDAALQAARRLVYARAHDWQPPRDG